MEAADLVQSLDLLWSPAVFAGLLALSALLVWLSFAPAPPRTEVENRLNDYLTRDVAVERELEQPLFRRAIWPVFRSLLHLLARFLPHKGLEATRVKLQQAGNPGGMTALDFYGVRVLILLVFASLGFLYGGRNDSLTMALQMAVGAASVGFILPVYWLRTKVRSRKNKVLRALPDALDMLTVGVEAGLAFESALVRVGEKWHNTLTQEFQRAVGEMRMGMTREEALRRMADRCDVPELTTFVAVLAQSSQLGVSIAQVLHAQAEEMRLKRRQRAEELARQAGLKMIFPLAFFVLPSLFVVILGPLMPRLQEVFRAMNGP